MTVKRGAPHGRDGAQDQTIFLGYGSKLIIPVYGEVYAQGRKQTALKRIYANYGNKIMNFSLLPQSEYQKEREWPEMPFLNVVPFGETTQNADNWLGYIHPFEPENDDEEHITRQKYTAKLVKLGMSNKVVVKGKVVKEGSEYSMLLFASRKEIDAHLSRIGTRPLVMDDRPKPTPKSVNRIKKTQETKFYKQWWFWLIVVLVILALMGQSNK